MTTLQFKKTEGWDAIAANSDSAWFTHLSDWIEIESMWNNVKNYSFWILNNEILAGICPLFLVRKKGFKYLTSGYKGWGGPAFVKGITLSMVLDTFKHIDELAKETGADWVDIKIPSIVDVRINPLYLGGYSCIQGRTSIIDLRKNEEILFQSVDKKCRYEIRKPDKLGLKLQFTEAKSLKDIEEYYQIHCENYARTGAPANPFWYFEQLWTRFLDKGIVKFFFIEENGKKVAAASVAIWKGRAIYLTGASLNESLGKGLNHYLQWNIIRFLRNLGVSLYEMGEIEDSTDKAVTLGRFKESFGGRLSPLYSGVKVYHPIMYKLYNCLRKWRSKL